MRRLNIASQLDADEANQQERAGSAKERCIVLLALPGSSLFDLFSAVEIFQQANRLTSSQGIKYRVQIIGLCDFHPEDAFAAPCKLHLYTECEAEIDTLLVVGGRDVEAHRSLPELASWVRERCRNIRRFGALGSGSSLLAQAGLLDDRVLTTHWCDAHSFTISYPHLQVVPDKIFVRAGNCYTSAGASATLDLALSLVSEDLGSYVADEIARRMVMFVRRSGDELQLSATINAQVNAGRSLGRLLTWMADNLEADLSVEALARRAAMSTRTFARHFSKDVGVTPARYVRDLRLEAAKRLLGSSLALKEVAKYTGFRSPETLRRTFVTTLGRSAGQLRTAIAAAQAS